MSRASDIPLADRTPAQREQATREELEAANTPPPLTKEQKLQMEKDHIAAQEWMQGEKRYEASMDGAAKLAAALKQLKLPCTIDGLNQAFEFCLRNGLLKAKPEPQPDPNAPKSLGEWVAIYGYTTTKIRDTPKEKLRALMKDPFQKKLIDYTLENRI
jgi:hypothetical protein